MEYEKLTTFTDTANFTNAIEKKENSQLETSKEFETNTQILEAEELPEPKKTRRNLGTFDITFEANTVIGKNIFLNEIEKITGGLISANLANASDDFENMDLETVGIYSVNVFTENSFITANVKIVDEKAPELNITNYVVHYKVGEQINIEKILLDAGVSAVDNYSKEADIKVFVEGFENIDFGRNAEFSIFVSAKDKAGNESVRKGVIVSLTSD